MNHLYQANKQVMETIYAVAFSTLYISASIKKTIKQNTNADGLVFNMSKY